MSERINMLLSSFKKQGRLVVQLDNETTVSFYDNNGTFLYKLEGAEHAKEVFEAWSN